LENKTGGEEKERGLQSLREDRSAPGETIFEVKTPLRRKNNEPFVGKIHEAREKVSKVGENWEGREDSLVAEGSHLMTRKRRTVQCILKTVCPKRVRLGTYLRNEENHTFQWEKRWYALRVRFTDCGTTLERDILSGGEQSPGGTQKVGQKRG